MTYAVKKKNENLYWNKYKQWVDLQKATTYIIKPTQVINARSEKCYMVEVEIKVIKDPKMDKTREENDNIWRKMIEKCTFCKGKGYITRDTFGSPGLREKCPRCCPIANPQRRI